MSLVLDPDTLPPIEEPLPPLPPPPPPPPKRWYVFLCDTDKPASAWDQGHGAGGMGGDYYKLPPSIRRATEADLAKLGFVRARRSGHEVRCIHNMPISAECRACQEWTP